MPINLDRTPTLEVSFSEDSEFVTTDSEAFTKLLEDVAEVKVTLSRAKNDYIAVLGLFASIVTFVLVEIQILQKVCSFDQLLGLSLIVAALLLLFNFLIGVLYQLTPSQNFLKSSYLYLLVFIIIIFILGIYFANRGLADSCLLTTLTTKVENLNNEFVLYSADAKEVSQLIKDRLMFLEIINGVNIQK